MQLADLVADIRSKNAGPFWITVDIFCGDNTAYQKVSGLLDNSDIARLYQQPVDKLQRYDLPNLYVIKFSFPRTVVQGNRFDRDMHGAQYAVLLAELDV